MLLRLFRSNQPYVMAILILSMIMLWIIPFINFRDPQSLLTEGGLLRYLSEIPSVQVLKIGGFLLIAAHAFIINNIFNKGDLFSKDTYLPGALYVFSVCYDPDSFLLSSKHIFFLAFLLTLRLVIHLRRDKPAIETAFLFGLIIGLGSLIYLPGILVIPVCWLFVALIRPFQWREYLAPVTGLLVVSAFVFTWYYAYSNKPELEDFLIRSDNLKIWKSGVKELTFTIFVLGGIMALVGLVRWFAIIQKSTMRYKKITRSFMLALLYVIGVNVWLYINHLPHYLVFSVALLIAFLSTYYFHDRRWNTIKIILFHLFIVLIVINHFV